MTEESIRREFLALIGGATVPLSQALEFPEQQRAQCLQVEDDFGLWINGFAESTADWINHWCDPNAGMSGQIALVAMRDIAPGEEVSFDYAMCGGSALSEVFHCGKISRPLPRAPVEPAQIVNLRFETARQGLPNMHGRKRHRSGLYWRSRFQV